MNSQKIKKSSSSSGSRSSSRSISYWNNCKAPGNEAIGSPVKEGTTKEQVDRSTSYPEVKTILKAKRHSVWRLEPPRYNKADPYYLLSRLLICWLVAYRPSNMPVYLRGTDLHRQFYVLPH